MVQNSNNIVAALSSAFMELTAHATEPGSLPTKFMKKRAVSMKIGLPGGVAHFKFVALGNELGAVPK
jgi:hypothetical protein